VKEKDIHGFHGLHGYQIMIKGERHETNHISEKREETQKGGQEFHE
jgi:hypothetical protein